jgi:prevent-host-death family protein
MTRQMTITEVKAKLLSLMDDVESGEEIEITRHGLTVARLVPARRHHDLKGLHAGKVKINVPDEELYSTGVSWEAQ